MAEKIMDEIDKFMNEDKKKSTLKQKKDDGWIMTKEGKLMPRLKNITKLFREEPDLMNLFEYNEFTGDVTILRDTPWGAMKGENMRDQDDIFLKGYFSEIHDFEPSVNLISEGVLLEANRNRRHPIKEYLESLKWDGKKRIDNWLVKAVNCEDNPYTRIIGKKLLCAMVRRIYEKGCKFDYMIILEGKQGMYKSTMLETLGGEWYAPLTELQNHKEAVDIMRGKWILEVEELAAMRKADLEHIKAFLSRRVDRTRLSYGRKAQDFPRQSVIVGTMNPVGDNEYFKDASGNRRFWPVRCEGMIKLKWVKEIRDQLFAETMQIWRKEKLYLDDKLAETIAVKEQQERKVSDAWEDIIAEYVERKEYTTINELMRDALHISIDKINRPFMIRVGLIMGQMGWVAKRYGRHQTKYFIREGVDIAEAVKDTKVMWDEEA